MAESASNIINITTSIAPAGLGFANFASAVMFAPEDELPAGFSVDTFREYTSVSDLAVDFSSTTETYKAAATWLGAIPTPPSIKVWGRANADANWTATLNKARNSTIKWWFWSFFTIAEYSVAATVIEIATWHNQNGSYFINCQTGTAADAIRDPGSTTDIASTLTTAGYRYASTFAHKTVAGAPLSTDAYAGIALAPWFATVDYSGTNTATIADFKKLSGVSAEDLTGTAIAAMRQDTKKCQYYTTIDLQGSTDNGRVRNGWSHSSYGEWMDDVINLAAFENTLQVTLYDAVANAEPKLPQTPAGQAVLIKLAKSVCEQYIENGYLGPRDYIDPDDGKSKFTRGYEILTKAEDILDISTPDRDARKSAPLRIRIFRAGAIQVVDINLGVF